MRMNIIASVMATDDNAASINSDSITHSLNFPNGRRLTAMTGLASDKYAPCITRDMCILLD